MIEVTIESTTVTETLEIVYSLRERLTMDEDFRYKFIQGGYDTEAYEDIPHKTKFYFTDENTALWFRLTYL